MQKKYADNMSKYAQNMHRICIKNAKKYADKYADKYDKYAK